MSQDPRDISDSLRLISDAIRETDFNENPSETEQIRRAAIQILSSMVTGLAAEGTRTSQSRTSIQLKDYANMSITLAKEIFRQTRGQQGSAEYTDTDYGD